MKFVHDRKHGMKEKICLNYQEYIEKVSLQIEKTATTGLLSNLFDEQSRVMGWQKITTSSF